MNFHDNLKNAVDYIVQYRRDDHSRSNPSAIIKLGLGRGSDKSYSEWMVKTSNYLRNKFDHSILTECPDIKYKQSCIQGITQNKLSTDESLRF